jgi:hypothetical protein
MRRALICCLILSTATLAVPRLARAGCAPVASNTPRVWLAAADLDTVEITFLGHASFEIVSPAGVRAVTDYNGINIPDDPPDIATMNHAHSTHSRSTQTPASRMCCTAGRNTTASLPST